MLQKSKKAEIIKDLEATIKGSESLVFVNFHGLKVSDETVLRRSLRAAGVGYKVSRKTLLARALQSKALGEIPELAGEVAIAYSEDEIASPREVLLSKLAFLLRSPIQRLAVAVSEVVKGKGASN